MCGILGYIGPEKKRPAGLDDALSMLDHRGPDGRGTWSNAARSVWLGHTRLSIVDLTGAGAQPMEDPATGNVIVFNGEIYNHPELRRELEQLGVVFKGHSDTETLLKAYGMWGPGVFRKLRGMFALAVWDKKRQRLVLARDVFGIKPLYFVRVGENGVCFASEARPLLRLNPQKLSAEGIASYLQRGVHDILIRHGFECLSEEGGEFSPPLRDCMYFRSARN